MSTKPKTIAAAEKRVIKNEISTLKKTVRKMDSDLRKFITATQRARKALDRQSIRAATSHKRETAAATRRIGILVGRL